ncbi:unnamed protein product [Phaeothamnion confervicola]
MGPRGEGPTRTGRMYGRIGVALLVLVGLHFPAHGVRGQTATPTGTPTLAPVIPIDSVCYHPSERCNVHYSADPKSAYQAMRADFLCITDDPKCLESSFRGCSFLGPDRSEACRSCFMTCRSATSYLNKNLTADISVVNFCGSSAGQSYCTRCGDAPLCRDGETPSPSQVPTPAPYVVTDEPSPAPTRRPVTAPTPAPPSALTPSPTVEATPSPIMDTPAPIPIAPTPSPSVTPTLPPMTPSPSRPDPTPVPTHSPSPVPTPTRTPWSPSPTPRSPLPSPPPSPSPSRSPPSPAPLPPPSRTPTSSPSPPAGSLLVILGEGEVPASCLDGLSDDGSAAVLKTALATFFLMPSEDVSADLISASRRRRGRRSLALAGGGPETAVRGDTAGIKAINVASDDGAAGWSVVHSAADGKHPRILADSSATSTATFSFTLSFNGETGAADAEAALKRLDDRERWQAAADALGTDPESITILHMTYPSTEGEAPNADFFGPVTAPMISSGGSGNGNGSLWAWIGTAAALLMLLLLIALACVSASRRKGREPAEYEDPLEEDDDDAGVHRKELTTLEALRLVALSGHSMSDGTKLAGEEDGSGNGGGGGGGGGMAPMAGHVLPSTPGPASEAASVVTVDEQRLGGTGVTALRLRPVIAVTPGSRSWSQLGGGQAVSPSSAAGSNSMRSSLGAAAAAAAAASASHPGSGSRCSHNWGDAVSTPRLLTASAAAAAVMGGAWPRSARSGRSTFEADRSKQFSTVMSMSIASPGDGTSVAGSAAPGAAGGAGGSRRHWQAVSPSSVGQGHNGPLGGGASAWGASSAAGSPGRGSAVSSQHSSPSRVSGASGWRRAWMQRRALDNNADGGGAAQQAARSQPLAPDATLGGLSAAAWDTDPYAHGRDS